MSPNGGNCYTTPIKKKYPKSIRFDIYRSNFRKVYFFIKIQNAKNWGD